MPTTQKRKRAVKKTTRSPKRSAAKRTSAAKTGERTTKTLVLEVVRKLEELPQRIGKKPKKRRSPAARKSLMTKVVKQLEELPRKIRKAAKKKTRRS